jgi:iron complex outermembrane receptor protein
VEAAAVWEPRAGQHITLSFSGLHGQFGSPENIVTEYAFNYPMYDGVMEWRGALGKRVIARSRIGVVDRVARGPYAIWDASLGYATGHVRPFLQLTNITNTVYQDIPLVAMPARGVIGGMELYVFGASR